MRSWANLIVVLFILPLPAWSQEEAQRRFEAMEKALTTAKTMRVDFVSEAKDVRGMIKMKGTITLDDSNRCRLFFEGGEGDLKSKSALICDGKTMHFQTEITDRTFKNSRPAPEGLCASLALLMSRTSIATTINVLSIPNADLKLIPKVMECKSIGKEKTDGKDVEVIEVTMKSIDPNNRLVCKYWLDSKSNLPLKRVTEMLRDGQSILNTKESYAQWETNVKISNETFAVPK